MKFKNYYYDNHGGLCSLKNQAEIEKLITDEIDRITSESTGDCKNFWRKTVDSNDVSFFSDEFSSDIRNAIEKEEGINIIVLLDEPLQGVKELLFHTEIWGGYTHFIFTENVLEKLGKSYIVNHDIKDVFTTYSVDASTMHTYLVVDGNLLIGYDDSVNNTCICDCIKCPSDVYDVLVDVDYILRID